MVSPESVYRPRPITPLDAVADAMMVAQIPYIDTGLKKYDKLNLKTLAELEDEINVASTARCYSSSDHVIWNLSTAKSRDLFTGAVVLSGSDTADSPHHGVFLVRGVDCVWYAGSPANNRTYTPRFSRLYSSNSLQDVLDGIMSD